MQNLQRLLMAHTSISRTCKNSFGYWRVSGLPNLATSTTEPDPKGECVQF
jgi:hypothetical protein